MKTLNEIIKEIKESGKVLLSAEHSSLLPDLTFMLACSGMKCATSQKETLRGDVIVITRT